ncbi:CinA family nicotinamide mononucleotide deamidase-related protein [Psychrobium sp. 1_MG-2023]|uniref:CinA family nicotinamide mononucleotide deamidase-related protein n=1 Tax=Psychrobium sp. 1_MG-2023 TaxID=3062624 RepID=UPI000C320E7C|nr:CinA family nicotinamide mononucleotide deamidase-related protein [Psychrobium sp. 1_MG-2023]MDP2562706.1 CinA family nicotinamide mononucleotide deamidase-related protein [Psychrobium sp. 1_MG-2023]PKF54030.1 damage-inducible protein CinA [Alteromonadales bacterium alter-6D02]
MKKLKIELLLTGNELVSGDVVDTNSAFIAQQLGELGLEVARRVTLKDDTELLTEEIIHLSQRSDILIINGGLGPTVDDMTAQALADAANLPISCHPKAIAHLEHWCQKRGFELDGPNKKQAMLPQGCDILANKNGSAVGFSLTLNNCIVFTTPGVPHELKTMLNDEIIPKLRQYSDSVHTTDVSRFLVFGLGESTIQGLVDKHLPDWPADIELGFRAARPYVEIKLTSHAKSAHQTKVSWQQKLEELLGAHIIGPDKTTVEQSLVETLNRKKQSVTFAESCTGGLMASKLTSVPGSSSVFGAGFVTYSNEIKHQVLDVDQQVLSIHGAVSQPVVEQMLQGALRHSQADYGVAVSGIAGPTGGSDEKPVGLVWIAWGDKDNHQSIALYIPVERHYFQHYVATVGLDLVKRHIKQIDEQPLYLVSRQFKPNQTY